MVELTIVIPHKNRPKLLEKLLSTIPERSDIEVIIVDDGSDYKVVNFDEFPGKERTNTKIIYSKESGGGGYARNMALPHAKGVWLLFADSDDYFNKGFYDKISKYLKESLDVIYFKANSTDLKTNELSDRTIGYNKFIDLAIKEGNYDYLRYQVAYPWAKLIKNDLISNNNIKFEEISNGNDVFFSLKVGEKGERFLAVDEVIYTVTSREEHALDVKSLDKYLVLYNTFYRKSIYLKKIGRGKFAYPNLVAFWVKIYRCKKSNAIKLLPKTIKVAGLIIVLRFIYKPVFFEFLADFKSNFPNIWDFLKN